MRHLVAGLVIGLVVIGLAAFGAWLDRHVPREWDNE